MHLQNPVAIILIPLATILASSVSADDDIRVGQSLHDQSCVECHASISGGEASRIYTRDDRIVTSFDSLVTQVDRCNVNLDVGWFPDEVEAVARYLDAEHYQF